MVTSVPSGSFSTNWPAPNDPPLEVSDTTSPTTRKRGNFRIAGEFTIADALAVGLDVALLLALGVALGVAANTAVPPATAKPSPAATASPRMTILRMFCLLLGGQSR
jgi:hypothetical protein